MKKKIALVSITVNAVGPMSAYLSENHPELQVTNYLDGYLMEKIRADGGVDDRSMARMLQLLSLACEDRNDAIIITCTVFSKYQPYFQSLFSVPVISADTAMLEAAAAAPGRTAIVYSFPGTYRTTRSGYCTACRKLGKAEEVDMILAEGAFEAAQNGFLEESDRIVRDLLSRLDADYDNIALAQISLVGAAKGLQLKHARLFSSPACAVDAMEKALENRQQEGISQNNP